MLTFLYHSRLFTSSQLVLFHANCSRYPLALLFPLFLIFFFFFRAFEQNSTRFYACDSPSKHRAYRAFISLGTSYLHRRGRCFRFFLLFFFKGVHLILAWSRSRIETRENSYHSHFFDNFNFNLRIEVIFISERYQFDDSNSRILHFLSRVILLYMVLHSIPRLCSFPSQAFHPHYFICAATRYHSKISAGTWSFQLRVYYRVCFRS